ncbi:hypothetical protein BFZC1_18525 [Lysinibacillus fusiformis ZC1]|nr:hypothetical protein BFZC1_18525 [Lysinibacillus fusiformis ZC1]
MEQKQKKVPAKRIQLVDVVLELLFIISNIKVNIFK